MFRYQKADPEGHPRRRTIRLHQAGEAFILLVTQGRGPSLPTEAACPLTLLLLRLRWHHPRDEHLFPTVAMARGTAMGWSITMRNTGPVLTARRASTTGAPVPSPLRRLLPRHWSENVSEWGTLTHTSAVLSPLLLLRPTWPGTEAPSDEPPLRPLRRLATGIPMSGPGSPRCPGLRCMELPVPGTPSRRECRHHCRRRHHLDIQAIRRTRV